jgi:hypothetical protein
MVAPFDTLRVLRDGAPPGWKRQKRWRTPKRECNSSQQQSPKIVITPDGDGVPPQSYEPGKPSRVRATRIEIIATSESHLPVPLQINNIFRLLDRHNWCS